MATLGISRLMASMSSTVSVLELVAPVPLRTPPTFCAPAPTKSRFVPTLAICSCTEACAPWPMLTMAITAETPMTMPSMVRAERILLRASARKAIRKITSMFMRSNLQFFISPIGLIGPNTAIPGMKNYGHLSRRPGRKIGAEKGKKAVCFIFLPTSFCQALFASSQAGSNRELLVLIVLSIVIILIIQRGQCLEFFGGVASMKHRLVASDLAVAEDDDA